MNKPTFFMLVGLPGSGKSTYAKEHFKGAVICSSDSIREELIGDANSQDRNDEVFEILHQRIKENLKAGNDVVYDACNINSRRRMAFLNELKNINCNKECYIMAIPYEECLERNMNRERKVPEEVIKRMYFHWNTPYLFEGWDYIGVVSSKKSNRKSLKEALNYVVRLSDFEQNNPYHYRTLGVHSLLTLWNLNNVVKYNDPYINSAALLHDIGKVFTKSFTNSKGEKTVMAHYYCHENVGAYDVLTYKDEDISRILTVSILINLHMRPYAWEDAKNPQKLKDKFNALWGEALFDRVMAIHAADRMSL